MPFTSLMGLLLVVSPGADADTFGVAMFLPSKPGTTAWTSAHWNNGVQRNVKYAADPYDPTGWTEDHSGSTDGFLIDGRGTMRMSGGSPRFHVNSLRSGARGAQFFRDVEFTGYYRRAGMAGAAYGGMVVGVRSGPLGHASSGGDDCDATTYYARFRHDGKWDFEKELKHPESDWWAAGGLHTQTPLWGGAKLPEHRWIGVKYLVWNLPDGRGVHLESWIDSVSGGDPAKAVWRKVGEVADTGTWPGASSAISGCTYSDPLTVILEGHGTMLLRTDGDTAQYAMVSLREIVAPASGTAVSPRSPPRRCERARLEVLPGSLRRSGRAGVEAVSADGRRIAVAPAP